MVKSNDDIEASTTSSSAEDVQNCYQNSATVDDDDDTSILPSSLHPQQPNVNEHLPPPPPSPLMYDNNTNSNYYPPLVKRRRAFSYEGALVEQQQQRLGSSSNSDTFHSPLRTIPSKCEMNDDDNNNIISEEEEGGQQSLLFATPKREYKERGSSFSTPERRTNNQSLEMNIHNNRDRANTCPHHYRPQHLIFEDQQEGEGDDDEESCHYHESRGSAAAVTTPNRAQGVRSVRQSLDSILLSRAYVSSREEESRSANNTNYSRERRNHSSPSVVVRASPATAANNEPLLRTSTPTVVVTPTHRLSRPRAQTTDGTTTATTPTRTTLITIPNSPASVNRLRSYSSSLTSNNNNTSTNNNNDNTPTSTSSSPITATQRHINQAQIFLLFRVNPLLIKLFMITSLYIVLSYTWNTDFKVRYKSMEINYGLSEYWQRYDGKLVNDDYNNVNVGHDDVAKLLANGRRGGMGDGSSDDGEDDGPLLLDRSSRTTNNDKKDTIIKPTTKKRTRPSLSYARSNNAYGVNHRRAYTANSRQNPSSSSKYYHYTWKSYLLWLVFIIPIIEVGLKEIRRQLNIRFWNVRRLRNFRGMSSSGGGSSRMGNVHNL